MSVLEDLWYGNIAPWEREIKRSSEYADVLERIVELEADLHARLNDEEKEILEKFVNCTNEMCCISERDMFTQGFLLGANLIIEVMTEENGYIVLLNNIRCRVQIKKVGTHYECQLF